MPPAPRGVPQIEVTFDIDANGIVHVSAKDLGTGKEQSMVISGGTALGKDDINQMIKDAEAHAEEDKRKREEAETRNTADPLVWQTENLLKEQGDKVPADDRQKIEDALKRLKDALAGADIDAVKRAHESLLTASNEFTRGCTRTCRRSSRPAATPVSGAAQPSDDEVADAEIVDDDDQQSA